MGTHPIFESDFDCLTGNSFEVMAEQFGKKAGGVVQKGIYDRSLQVDTTALKYDKFLADLLDELDDNKDKDEFEERFDDYLKKDEVDKFKPSGSTIDDKVKTVLDLLNEHASHFDEDDLAEAKRQLAVFYPDLSKDY